MKELPRIGEVWWLCDAIVLVIGFKSEMMRHVDVMTIVLFDLDEFFDPGEDFTLSVDGMLIDDADLTEQNRKIA